MRKWMSVGSVTKGVSARGGDKLSTGCPPIRAGIARRSNDGEVIATTVRLDLAKSAGWKPAKQQVGNLRYEEAVQVSWNMWK